MRIEQGTPVAVSIIDLPHNLDLPDLRLPRVFKAWNEFKLRYEPQILSLGTLPVNEVVALGGELSLSIRQAMGMGETPLSSHLNPEKISLLTGLVFGEGNKAIFMRHGEQSPPEWISSIPDPGLRKIRMMQNPFNRTDLLTNTGLLDAFVTGLGLLYVQQVSRKSINLLSSENMRAQEVARIVSKVVSGASFSTLEGLSCITYQDERSNPAVTTEQLLDYLPSGTMPWDPKLIDRFCKRTRSGLKQSELIINTIRDLVNEGTSQEGEGNLLIALTHTQQLAEVLRQRGKLEDPMIRFPELTMLVLAESRVQILPLGILAEKER